MVLWGSLECPRPCQGRGREFKSRQDRVEDEENECCDWRGTGGTVTLSQMVARMTARDARHAARIWPLRRAIDAWWWLRRMRYRAWHPRPWRRVQWRWQRSVRGWADCDVSSLDSYIAGLLSGALLKLARGHGYPGREPWETPEKWEAYLKDLSARLAAWNDSTWTDDGAYETTRAAAEEFGHNLGVFWD